MRTPIQIQRPYISYQELIGLFLYLTAFSLVFGFYALRQDSDPEDCLATTESDSLIKLSSKVDTEENYINVGARFRFCFEILFLMHIFSFVSVILIRIAPTQLARSIYFVVPPIVVPLLFVMHLVLFYSRFVHSGRVCSGDYLDVRMSSTQGYLIAQGSFIESYATILSVTIYFFWCCICFVSARRTAIK